MQTFRMPDEEIVAALLQPVYDDSMRGIALIQVGETLEARRVLSKSMRPDSSGR